MLTREQLARIRKRYWFPFLGAAAAIFGAALFLFFADYAVERCGNRVYHDVASLEARDVGLLLGTAPVARYGENTYFTYRIQAAAALYHAGKVRKLIVSGDNGRKDYDEPTAMRIALEKQGVRSEDIVEDYAGFRTLDSVIRARQVFGISNYIVISQEFHCKRAIFIADHYGIDAIGFAARDVRYRSYRRRNALRETAARAAAVLDICLQRSPRFLGRPISIEHSSAEAGRKKMEIN